MDWHVTCLAPLEQSTWDLSPFTASAPHNWQLCSKGIVPNVAQWQPQVYEALLQHVPLDPTVANTRPLSTLQSFPLPEWLQMQPTMPESSKAAACFFPCKLMKMTLVPRITCVAQISLISLVPKVTRADNIRTELHAWHNLFTSVRMLLIYIHKHIFPSEQIMVCRYYHVNEFCFLRKMFKILLLKVVTVTCLRGTVSSDVILLKP